MHSSPLVYHMNILYLETNQTTTFVERSKIEELTEEHWTMQIVVSLVVVEVENH